MRRSGVQPLEQIFAAFGQTLAGFWGMTLRSGRLEMLETLTQAASLRRFRDQKILENGCFGWLSCWARESCGKRVISTFATKNRLRSE